MDFKTLVLMLLTGWSGPLVAGVTPSAKGEMFRHDASMVGAGLRYDGARFSKEEQARHYVVIGAFRELGNANQLIKKVASVGFDPKYFLNKQRGLYYVYIVIHDDLMTARRVSAKLRDINFIKDAWVYSAETGEPISERLIASAETNRSALLSDAVSERHEKQATISPASPTAKRLPKENIKSTSSETNSNPPQVEKYAAPKSETVSAALKSNSSDVKPTSTEASGSATFKPTPSEAINQLAKADKGDIIVFDNLLFHKNSSVLRKVSKDEMQRLNEILKTKSNLRIKIHGHTNGDFKGEVYLLAENDERFFKLSGKNKVVKGDDKLLSTERARVIKRYLGAQGISTGRIETQGWGDRRMLYPKGHLKAPLNRRVEIEVLEN